MSHASHHKKFNGQNIDVVVTIRYRGLKATQYFSKFTDQSLRTLRHDVLQLKIPHPKAENVVLVTHGCVEFSWFNIEPHGVLHNNLIQKLRPQQPQQQEALETLLEELSIASATFRETPLRQDGASKKRPNPYSPMSEPPKKRLASSANPVERAAVDFIKHSIANVNPGSVKSEPLDVSLPPPPPVSAPPSVRFHRFGPSISAGPLLHSAPMKLESSVEEPPNPTKLLVKELWDLRRQLAAGITREAFLIDELKKHCPAYSGSILTPAFSSAGIIDRGEEVKGLQAQLQSMKQELEKERSLRRQSEAALQDIRRETQNPFIVPKLLDALVEISKLTTQVAF